MIQDFIAGILVGFVISWVFNDIREALRFKNEDGQDFWDKLTK
jgi:hypothetical protein